MKHKVQVIYNSGRTVNVEAEGYNSVDDMIKDMASSTFFVHDGGAENMLFVERIKPLQGASVMPRNEIRRV